MAEAPDVGTLFDYRASHYVVTGWLKPVPNPKAWMQPVGPDRVPVMFCTRDEAVYVSGRGVAGCIARLGDITITGVVNWSAPDLSAQRDFANRLAVNAQVVF